MAANRVVSRKTFNLPNCAFFSHKTFFTLFLSCYLVVVLSNLTSQTQTTTTTHNTSCKLSIVFCWFVSMLFNRKHLYTFSRLFYATNKHKVEHKHKTKRSLSPFNRQSAVSMLFYSTSITHTNTNTTINCCILLFAIVIMLVYG